MVQHAAGVSWTLLLSGRGGLMSAVSPATSRGQLRWGHKAPNCGLQLPDCGLGCLRRSFVRQSMSQPQESLAGSFSNPPAAPPTPRMTPT